MPIEVDKKRVIPSMALYRARETSITNTKNSYKDSKGSKERPTT
jgi:hypothetical protein